FSQTQFFYGLVPVFYDPSLTPLLRRGSALPARPINGPSVFGIFRSSRHTRVELHGGGAHYHDAFRNQLLQDLSDDFQEQRFGARNLNNGTAVPLGAALVHESTVFREYGPLAGSTFRLAYQVAPKMGNTLSRQTFDGDVRYYQRIGSNGVAAF